MSRYENIFTDSVKDVIGNDPVLDQFDNYYISAFYGSSQDDYITGSLVSTQRQGKEKKFITGSRGKELSKLYADSALPLDSTYGSDIVEKIPSLAYRLQPWHERVSVTSLRSIQCFDESERYYDSCLPDLKTCFNANQARVWTIASGSQLYDTALSPYGNVTTGSTGYMFFNTVLEDRTSQGYDKDPLVNNEWTWSYPYESKYNPGKRILKTSNTLGIDRTDISADWSLQYNSYATDWVLTVDNLQESIVSPQSIKGILPILPGKLDNEEIVPFGGRNGLRGVYQGGSLFEAPTIYGIDSGLDGKLGVSLLIPSDVDLSKKTNHSFLGGSPFVLDPGPEYLTGSMSLDDSVKFFFGFGDLNNMTYSRFLKKETDHSYLQDFERTGDYTFYFWGNTGTAQEPDSQSGNRDRDLSLFIEGSNVEIILNTSEVSPTGWQLFGASVSQYWITELNIPNVSEIPAGKWTFHINSKATNPGFFYWKASIYSWDGTSMTPISDSASSSHVSNVMSEITFDWVISSPITLSNTDRIAVQLYAYVPSPTSNNLYLETSYDYGSGPVYSRVVTNVPQDPVTLPEKKANTTDSYSDGVLSVNWQNSPVGIHNYNNWFYGYRQGSAVIDSTLYNYIVNDPLETTTNGIYWTETESNFVLVTSAVNASLRGVSTCCVDITSSLPWSLKYDRAFIGNSGNYLKVYFSGIPGSPSGVLAGGPFTESLVLEYLTPPEDNPLFSVLSSYDSAITNGGNPSDPYLFGPGAWRLVFLSSFNSSGRAASAIDNLEITTYEIEGDPDGPKIGGNNYPKFRTKKVDNRYNPVKSGTSVEVAATKGIYESYIFGVSPVIRGWKYGLFNGLPVNSKAVFRRNRYGQLRDMLEQRQYTKFINVKDSPVEGDATSTNNFVKGAASRLTRPGQFTQVGPAVAEVNFFKQRYKKDERGIGYIYNEKVDPMLTTSQNLSTEVTSSVPYVDGVARHREESSFSVIADTSLISLSLNPNGMTVL